MRTLPFLCGALVGAAAVIWNSKRNGGKPMINGNNKIMKMVGLSSGQSSEGEARSNSSHSSSHSSAQKQQASPSSASASSSKHSNHSKEYNLKQLTDFIKGNPDVRLEVEKILKETNTVIPGL